MSQFVRKKVSLINPSTNLIPPPVPKNCSMVEAAAIPDFLFLCPRWKMPIEYKSD